MIHQWDHARDTRGRLRGARMARPDTTEPSATAPLRFGNPRITHGWAGIGVALGAGALLLGLLLAEAAPAEALLAVGLFALLLAALCAITRTVAVHPGRREVAVTRHLLGLRHTSSIPAARFERIEVLGYLFRRRYHWSDGTLEGDQKLMHYRLRLATSGIRRVQLDLVHDLDGVEATARHLAEALGLPAERRGYRVTKNPAGRRLAVVDRHAREPL